MKKSFYSGQDAAHRSQRQEQRASDTFASKQSAKQHQGRRATPTSAPLKSQPKQATGGYLKDPFRGLK